MYNYNAEGAWVIPIIALVCALYVSLNLLLIVVILSKASLRQRPGNWLIINLAICLLLEGVLFFTVPGLSYWTYWQYPQALCQFTLTLYHMLTILIPVHVLVITVEHYISIAKTGGSESGFSPVAALSCIAGVAVGALIYTLIMIFAVGNGFRSVPGRCHLNMVIYQVINSFSLTALIVLVLIIMSIIVIVKWQRSDKEDTRKVALPLVIANTYYILVQALSLFADIPFVAHSIGIVLPILWLVGSSGMRRAYCQTCCPCCPGGDDNEERHLLETK